MFMKYNCIYKLVGQNGKRGGFFSTESLAFEYADREGFVDPDVVVIRYFYEI